MQPIKLLVDFIDVRLGVKDLYNRELHGYLLPRNVNAWYTLGAVVLTLFTLQVVSGILLLMSSTLSTRCLTAGCSACCTPSAPMSS
jgi:ubiquinol-cytochrome c reductase cytochrome b subunit